MKRTTIAMSKRIFVFCIIAVGMCLMLLSLHKSDESAIATLASKKPNSSAHLRADQIQTLASPKVTRTNFDNDDSASVSNATVSKIFEKWKAPIHFYGKVVDENNNVVAGANVRFKWVEVPDETGNRTSSTQSDEQGLFSLHDQYGPNLEVSVSKKGYYSSGESEHPIFQYGAFANAEFSADPIKPVIFHLRKKAKGSQLVEKVFPSELGQIAQVRSDLTPVEIALDRGTKVPAETGQLKLEFWRDVSDMQTHTFDWKLQISVPGGGIVETDQEFPFEAPQTNYSPSILVSVLRSADNWKGELQTKYYIRLIDGRYGRIDFHFLAYNGVFRIKSAINPSGSRNLEPLSQELQ